MSFERELKENYGQTLDYARDYGVSPRDIMHDVLKEWRLALDPSPREQNEMYDALYGVLKRNGKL
jgi:hypothetical protein